LLEALSIIFQYDIEMREIPEIYENWGHRNFKLLEALSIIIQ
jgi:hypothetical protein